MFFVCGKWCADTSSARASVLIYRRHGTDTALSFSRVQSFLVSLGLASPALDFLSRLEMTPTSSQRHIEVEAALSRLDLPDRKFETDYRPQPVTGKGVGCVTTQAIPRGACLLSEQALFAVPKGRYREGYKTQAINIGLKPLTTSERKPFHDLHCPPNAESRLQGIFEANNFEVDKKLAIFPRASRFNHSCVPNAHFSWSRSLGLLSVYATKDIGAGKEITVNYRLNYAFKDLERGP